MKNKVQDPLMGLKCFSIAGPMVKQRQRCLGMTDEERRWRAQWLKDQVLSHDEPRFVPEYYKDTTNVFRRLWKTPFNKFQKFLEPKLGHDFAFLTRHLVGQSIYLLGILYGGYYFVKYHTNKFEKFRSVELFSLRSPMYADHPDYPNLSVKKPSDYYDQGFYSSVLCQDVEPLPVELDEPEPEPEVQPGEPCPKRKEED